MMLIPALDLINGRVVRLIQGDYTRQTDYGDDAIARALAYEKAGAQCLHVVDLDSAKGGGEDNMSLIRELCEALSIPVQTGGGVRSANDVEKRLNAGVDRVVVGSVCIQQPLTFAQWVNGFGPEHMVAGLDVKADNRGRWIPRASGWLEPGTMDLDGLLNLLMPSGLTHVLCTDIDRDGLMQGASTELYRHLVSTYPNLRVQASGGIGASKDLRAVADTGVSGCIVGRALLEGAIDLDSIARCAGTDDRAEMRDN